MSDAPKQVSELERRLDVAHHLPRLRWLVIAATAIAAVALWAWPLFASSRAGWSGGPVSNHHRLIEHDCAACHVAGFAGVADAKCAACHAVHDHGAAAAGHPTSAGPCASCHREHHDETDLVPHNSRLCADCHRHPSARLAATIADFTHHPEFEVQAWTGDPPKLGRVRVGQAGIRDASGLKFSHAGHLALPASVDADRGKPLECATCHEPTADGTDLAPVRYAQHCERCHSLEFDDRIKGSRVPHGDAARVYAFMRAEVARFHFGQPTRVDAAMIDKESRDDEAGLFTEGGACVMCHDVQAVPEASSDDPRFRVEVRTFARWMPAAKFEHAVHRLTDCTKCHAGIRGSRSAGEMLLPSIAICRDCHGEPGTPGKVASPCLECHAYHPADRR